MEYNLMCGEIIYINNKFKFKCSLCDNYEIYDAKQFEQHFYANHLLSIKEEELPPPPLLNDEPFTNHLLVQLEIDKIDNNNFIKKEIYDDNLQPSTLLLPKNQYNNTIKSSKDNNNLNPTKSSLLSSSPSSSPIKHPTIIPSISLPQAIINRSTTTKQPEKKCNFCKQKFVHRRNFSYHLQQNQNKQFSCFICTKNICGYRMLNEHMITDHPDSVPARKKKIKKNKINYHYCDICSGTFKSYQNLQKHMIIHSGEKPYVCTECDKRFSNSAGLMVHKRINHQEERPFLCNQCGKSYKMLAKLNMHIKEVHSIRAPLSCEICGKVIYGNVQLQRHIKLHTMDMSCKCKECGKILKTPKSMREHKKIHLQTKSYHCPFCDLHFSQAAGRRGHIRRMHE